MATAQFMQKLTHILVLVATFSLGFLSPASAEIGAFAAVQAPEAGTGVCMGGSADEARECAVSACVAESGLEPEYCEVATICGYPGWAIDVFMQHQEGIHWHEFSCGWQSREVALAAVKLMCRRDYLIVCDPVRLWSDEGVEEDLFESTN